MEDDLEKVQEPTTYKVKAYFEYEPADDDFDEEFQLDIKWDYKDNFDLMGMEIENIGPQKIWFEGMDLSKYPTGDYEIEYEYDWDAEYCDGYEMNRYQYVVGIVDMKPIALF